MRHYCAVVETSHLRRAAELLKMSPGALSKSLSKLQEELGARLLTVEGKSLLVTPEGKRFYHRTKKVLEQVDALVHRKEGEDESSGVLPRLTIGTFEVFSTYVLSECLSDFREFRIKLCELVPGAIENAVADGAVDLGVTYIPVPNSNVTIDRVTDFTFGAFGVSRWKRAPLEELPFSVPTTLIPQNPGHQHALDTWPSSRFPRKVAYEFQMLQTALCAASRGNCVIYIPRFVARLYNTYVDQAAQLHELPSGPGSPPKHSVYLVRRKGDEESPAAKKLAKHLRMLCRS